ncbi:DoxX family protein [Sphingomonas sp.]|uniref:DoxX family protein n=1 Tax=Sphingomonas sp. TaxID=28214 RepID=UPI003B3B4502
MPATFSRTFGRGLVVAAALLLLLDGVVQFASPAGLVAALVHIGFPRDAGPTLAYLTFCCALPLLLPRLAPLGAILTTGYLGGAICAHARIGELLAPPQFVCAALGGGIWIGLALADQRIAAALRPFAPPD